MPLWGTTHDSEDNKPKYLPDDKNSLYDKTHVFANQSGWVVRGGSKATGNGNTAADPEILVAIRGLAGATASTGLKHPTITNVRWQDAAVTHVAGTNNLLKLDVTWDEEVKYTAGTLPTIATATTVVTLTLSHIDGVAYHATNNNTGSTFTFTGSTSGAGTYSIANNTDIGNRTDLSDAVSTTALEVASGRILTGAGKAGANTGNCVAS